MPNDRRAFRLRFRDGRFAAVPFPPSLRHRFTFPFAEPQAEAFGGQQEKLMIMQPNPMAETSKWLFPNLCFCTFKSFLAVKFSG